MTKDLAVLAEGDKKVVTTKEFLVAIKERLEKTL